MPAHTISFVLPAFNEEENIVTSVQAATKVGDRLFREHEVLVVDDGSIDNTAALVSDMSADDPRVKLVRHGENRGYGEAVRSGFSAASMELVFLTDADLQFDMEELERFLPWIERVDIVAGYRIDRQDGLLRRVIARGWNLLVRIMFYTPVRDIDCAFKLFRRTVFDAVELQAMGAMVSTELMVRSARAGMGVVELGVHHYPRLHGQARGAHPRVIMKAFLELWRMRRGLATLGAAGLPHGILPARPMTRRDDGS